MNEVQTLISSNTDELLSTIPKETQGSNVVISSNDLLEVTATDEEGKVNCDMFIEMDIDLQYDDDKSSWSSESSDINWAQPATSDEASNDWPTVQVALATSDDQKTIDDWSSCVVEIIDELDSQPRKSCKRKSDHDEGYDRLAWKWWCR